MVKKAILFIVTILFWSTSGYTLQHAFFKGTVLDRNENPVPDVSLVLVHKTRGPKTIRVKKDGSFKCRLFEIGDYQIQLSAPGYLVYAVKMKDKGPTGVPKEAKRIALDERQEIPDIHVSPDHTYIFDFILVPKDFFQNRIQKEELGQVQNLILQAEEKIRAKSYEDALKLLSKAVEKKPDLGYPYYLMGVAEISRGHKTKARQHFLRALEKKPDIIGANYYLGTMAYENQEFDKAIGYFKSELKASPNHPETLQSLAVLYREQGQRKEAADTFETLRKIHPDDERILNELLVLYTDMGNDDKVKEIIAAQESLGNQDAGAYYNLGTTYWKKKDFQAAERAFRKALNKDPQLAPAHKGLAYCLIEQKKFHEARRHLEQYLELRKDAPDKDKIRNILKELPEH